MLDIFSLIAPLVTASLSPDIAPGPVCRPNPCYFEGCQVGDDVDPNATRPMDRINY